MNDLKIRRPPPKAARPIQAVGALVACLLLLPHAWAADADLCVSPEGTVDSGFCAGLPCEAYLGSFAEALETAALLPDIGGQRPHVAICLLADPAQPDRPHTESLVVDGSVAEPLELLFWDRMLCPDPGSEPDQALLELSTSGLGIIHGLSSDMHEGGDCPTARPGVSLSGGGSVILGLDLSGASGFGVHNGVEATPVELNITPSSIRNGTGPAVRSSGTTTLIEVLIAGNRVDDTTGGRALLWGEGDSDLFLRSSVVFGNLIVDEAGDRALVEASRAAIDNSTIVANGLVGVPLLRLGFTPQVYTASDTGLDSEAGWGVWNSVLSRNRQLASATDSAPPPFDAVDWHDPQVPHCGGLAPGNAWFEMDSPFAALEAGDGPLVVLEPDLGQTSQGESLFLRTAFIDNVVGDAPLVSFGGGGADLWVEFLHDTFAGNDSRQLIEWTGTTPGGGLVTIKNLQVDPVEMPLLGVPTYLSAVTSTWNVGPPGTVWMEPQSRDGWLLGPDLEASGQFRDPSEVRALDDCGRFRLVCPGTTIEDCVAWSEASLRLVCALDAAAAYVPSDDFAADLDFAWPWQTSFFPSAIDRAGIPGATGWTCSSLRGTADSPPDLSGGQLGDLDLYPDAVDCDNEDPDVFPQVPEYDGITSPYCEAPEGSCYVCPEGSIPPPQDDDDSGDDDDAGDDDDNSFLPDDDDSGGASVETGCGSSGCGFAWSCDDDGGTVFLAILLLPLSLRRRRSADPRHQ